MLGGTLQSRHFGCPPAFQFLPGTQRANRSKVLLPDPQVYLGGVFFFVKQRVYDLPYLSLLDQGIC